MKKFSRPITFILVLFTLIGCFAFSGCGSESDSPRASYNIQCTVDGNTLTGKETVVFYNNTDNAFSEIKFNLFPNAFRQGAKHSPIAVQYETRAYYAGKNYGDIKIEQVTVEGENKDFAISGVDNNILVVKLNNELYPGESVKISINFVTTLAKVISRTGINNKTINLANFYPILCGIEDGAFYECVYYSNGDPFYSDCADYQVSITVDKNLAVASSGKIVKKAESENAVTYTYSAKNMRSFAMVLSEQFELFTDNSTGVEINYYHYGTSGNPQVFMDYAVKAMKLFSAKYGQYPYPTFSIVKTPFIQGGMEFPGLVMISDELDEKSFGEVIVHETAHQWWQTAVGNNEIEFGFLDEGLAEYSVIVFYENYKEFGNTRQSLIKATEQTYKAFCSVYDKLFEKVDTSMLRSLGEYTSEYEYVNIAYMKPCIMYDNLRASIGDEKFFNALKRYYNENCFKNAKPQNLVSAFIKVGANVEGYFNSFFEGKVII